MSQNGLRLRMQMQMIKSVSRFVIVKKDRQNNIYFDRTIWFRMNSLHLQLTRHTLRNWVDMK